LLWISGGLLSLLKGAYYILAWKFGAEGRPSPIPKGDLPAVQLTSGNSPGKAPVTQLNFDKTNRYLGNILSTDMQMKKAYTALLRTSRSFASGILFSTLSKKDSWVAYFAVFVPSVAYGLPITHLSKINLRKIQSPAACACLMNTGFNRNTAHRVVFGPSFHGSLGFRDLFIEQGVSQVLLLLRHLRADSPHGRLFRVTIGWWQLVMGVSYPLLEHPTLILPHQAPQWLSALRQFLQQLQASIHIPGIVEKLPQPLQEADVNLMDEVLALPSLPRSQLLAFNRCRLFFRVAYLSEVSTADGTSIASDAWDGSRPRCSPLLWPYQPMPGPKSFPVWRRLLATAFL
jgi:hypothetical protein